MLEMLCCGILTVAYTCGNTAQSHRLLFCGRLEDIGKCQPRIFCFMLVHSSVLKTAKVIYHRTALTPFGCSTASSIINWCYNEVTERLTLRNVCVTDMCRLCYGYVTDQHIGLGYMFRSFVLQHICSKNGCSAHMFCLARTFGSTDVSDKCSI